ncbi:NADH:quinone oxidoreductase [Brevibacillus laterosporus]|uniref:NADH:quinone oxidoreductase n=1 Tax=Brevibacillus laterosporus TaxID=1465 RepID=A0A502HFL6_BRELA|nr:2Fe-2S iron-sulfur cluster-binding protein [Brevibacillus laterosporus]QDX93771.1 NADH:quinone oxidoreductase [Brevibacillus laterosporus]TPG73431.1 NADH:quinone oxidoreductase [Brevibacillus laterosporus]TPG89591.1 NADH:quinone oxidoreductase [Brevibacillus laterosporus]
MTKVTFYPSKKTVKARSGQTILQLSRVARVAIPTRCDGNAACMLCKITIEQGNVTPLSASEKRKLSERDQVRGIRLACQTRVTEEDVCIRVPESKWKSVVEKALERQRLEEEEW